MRVLVYFKYFKFICVCPTINSINLIHYYSVYMPIICNYTCILPLVKKGVQQSTQELLMNSTPSVFIIGTYAHQKLIKGGVGDVGTKYR